MANTWIFVGPPNYVCDFGRDAGGGQKWPNSNKMNKSKMFIGVCLPQKHKTIQVH